MSSMFPLGAAIVSLRPWFSQVDTMSCEPQFMAKFFKLLGGLSDKSTKGWLYVGSKYTWGPEKSQGQSKQMLSTPTGISQVTV